MAAKRKKPTTAKSAARNATKRAARQVTQKVKNKVRNKVYWKFRTVLPILIIVGVFLAAIGYGGYLESSGKDNEPVHVVRNFIEKDADLSVHYIDVGQGDSSLIVYDDMTVLIDAGETDQGDKVVEYITSLGITQLDYVICTHPHSDHIGGMPAVIAAFDIGTIIAPKLSDDITPTTKVYERFLKAVSKKGMRLTAAKTGEVYSLAQNTEEEEYDNTAFEILAPLSNYDDLNDWSIVVRLVHGENAFLFTGDAEEKAERDILEKYDDISADVLKVGHHGSSSSSSKAFVEAVNPSIAVIQCGEDNSYGHPHKETVELLEESGIEYYRNDQDGTVTVYSDGSELRVNTEKEDVIADVDN